MATLNNVLKSIYFDARHPAGFGTARQLLAAAKQDVSKVTLADVNEWLITNPTHTLHKTARHRFKRNPVFVERLDEQWQADLVDMQQYSRSNKGFKYLLTVIDILSKYAWVVPIKSKRGADVANAFKSIFEQGRTPIRLQTDQGKEFVNGPVRQLCADNSINFFTTKNKDIKCAVVERFNRTLKGRMFKLFTSIGKHRYVEHLQELVASYNERKHSVSKMKPIDVDSTNEAQVFANLYKVPDKREYLRRVHGKPKLNIGDPVRRKYPRETFQRGFHPNWSDQVFTVAKLIPGHRRPYYIVNGPGGSSRRLYPEEIQLIGETAYRIEKILRKRSANGQPEYYVKWLNYPSTYNSWVKGSDLNSLPKV